MTGALSVLGYTTDSDGFSMQLIPIAPESDIENLFVAYNLLSSLICT